MSKSIAAVLRDAAMQRRVATRLSHALPFNEAGTCAFAHVVNIRGLCGFFSDLTNEERSAFLYLCSLIAEDEE